MSKTISVEFSEHDLENLLDGVDCMERDANHPAKQIEFLLAKLLPDQCNCEHEEHHEELKKMKSQLISQEVKFRAEKKIRRKQFTLLKAKLVQAQKQAELSEDELDVLLDGVDALEQDNNNLPDKVEVFLARFAPGEDCSDDDHRKGYERVKSHFMSKGDVLKKEKKIRRETYTLLKAKIIRAQQEYAVSRLGDEDDE